MTRRRRPHSRGVARAIAAAAVLAACALRSRPATAAEMDLSAHNLDPALVNESAAVVRIDSLVFDVRDPGRAHERVVRAITILNAKGRAHGQIVIPYDRFRSLESLEGELLDAGGKRIRKLERADVNDLSDLDVATLYSDERVRMGALFHDEYPYTVRYEYEVDHRGVIAWPTWYPQKTPDPVERSVYALRVPAGMPIRHRARGLEIAPEVRETRDRVESVWRAASLPARKQEEWGPPWSEQAPSVLMAPAAFEIEGRRGDMSTWEAFGAWYRDLHADRAVLPPAASARVQQICEDAGTQREKVERLYAHLQSTTRYVSVQLGIGGWQAFEPAYVQTKGYGDCKALSNYMVAMLRAAGIEAYPALIRAGAREPDILSDFPSNQFNHVVVFVPLAADTLWLECTSQSVPAGYVGPFTDDRSALVITADGGRLVRTPHASASANARVCRARVKLDESGNGRVSSQTVHSGWPRERVRQAMETLTPRDRDEWLREEIDLPSFSIAGFSFRDLDSARAEFELALDLEVPRVLSFSGGRAVLTPNLMQRVTDVPRETSERTQPVWLECPYSESDSLMYELPRGLRVDELPDAIAFESAFGRYGATFEQGENALVYTRRFQVDVDTVAPDQYAAFRSFLVQAAKADREMVVLRR